MIFVHHDDAEQLANKLARTNFTMRAEGICR